MSVNEKNYITIQGWMINELDLKGNELLIYAIIYGFSQNNGNEFNGSLQYLADWTCTTKKSAFNNVKSLLEKGLIEKTEVFKGSAKYCTYKVTCQDSTVENISNCRSKNYHGTVENFTTNNTNNTNNNISKKEIIPPDIEDAKKYHSEKGYKFNLEEWFYYYESKGWMIGKNKIKSWKATMKTWDLNDKKKNKSYQSNPIQEVDLLTRIQLDKEKREREEKERQRVWEEKYSRYKEGNKEC